MFWEDISRENNELNSDIMADTAGLVRWHIYIYI